MIVSLPPVSYRFCLPMQNSSGSKKVLQNIYLVPSVATVIADGFQKNGISIGNKSA